MTPEPILDLSHPEGIIARNQFDAINLVRHYGLLLNPLDEARIKAGIEISMRVAQALPDEVLAKTPSNLNSEVRGYVDNLKLNIQESSPAFSGRPEDYPSYATPSLTKDEEIYYANGVIEWRRRGKMIIMDIFPRREGNRLAFAPPQTYTEELDEESSYKYVPHVSESSDIDRLKTELLQTKIMTQAEIDLFFNKEDIPTT